MKNIAKRLRGLLFRCLSSRAVHQRLLLPYSNGYKIELLRHFGAHIGETTRFHYPLIIINAGKDFSRMRIGNNVYVGHNVTLDLEERIEISDDVTISMNVVIATHTDVGHIPLARHYPSQKRPVLIKNNVYIGSGATILHGVTIGPHAIVAAGALVTQDVPPFTVVGGIPAAPLRRLEES